MTTEPRTGSLPEARKEGLVVEELDSELLIYDVNTDRAHCLTPAAAAVWKACDGRQTAASIAPLLPEGPGEEELVWRAVEELDELGLLTPEVTPSESRGWSRRDVLVRAGVAAAAAPLVHSIVAPTPAAAVTCLPQGTTCSTTAPCCNGPCRPNGRCP